MPSSSSSLSTCKPEVSLTRSSKSFFFSSLSLFYSHSSISFVFIETWSAFFSFSCRGKEKYRSISDLLIEKKQISLSRRSCDTPDAHMQVRSTYATSLRFLVITNCINNISLCRFRSHIFFSFIFSLSLSLSFSFFLSVSLSLVVSLSHCDRIIIIALHFSIRKNCSLQVCVIWYFFLSSSSSLYNCLGWLFFKFTPAFVFSLSSLISRKKRDDTWNHY